jgi:hypothetical protein
VFNTYDTTKPYDNQMGYPDYLIDRFWSKVEFKYKKIGILDLDDCMEWLASKNKRGYGYFFNTITNVRANRFIWECYNGPIPKGLLVCHSCDNPSCVNPKHLWIGTSQDNHNDRNNKNRQAKGSLNGAAKLNETDIITILTKIYNSKYTTTSEIRKDYNITYTTVYRILDGKNWKYTSDQFCKKFNCKLIDLKKKVWRIKTNLSNTDVIDIVNLIRSGKSYEKVSNLYNLHVTTINNIITGHSWSNVTGIKYNKIENRIGSNNGNVKLTTGLVKEIKRKLLLGKTCLSLAIEYSVCEGTISDIKLNKTWKYVII